MEKRLALFIVCSALILIGHLMLRQALLPRPPAADQAAEALEDTPPDAKPPASPPDAQAPPDAKASSDTATQTPPDEAGAGSDAHEATPAAEPAKPKPSAPSVPPQWLTLGSYAPDSSSRLLITFTNRGAAIERVELVERRSNGSLRYRDLADKSGYLGLQCRDAAGGCTVTSVGPGTPAALATADQVGVAAGLVADDVIESIDGVTVPGAYALDAWLQGTRPGQTVRLGVHRRAADSTQHLLFTATLDVRPLALIERESTTPSYLLGLHRLGPSILQPGESELKDLPSLRQENWEVAAVEADQVTFRYRLPGGDTAAAGGLEFVKRYRIVNHGSPAGAAPTTGYDVDMQVEIVNHGAEPEILSYALDGPTGLPIEGWWYSSKMHPTAWGAAGARDVIWRIQGNRSTLRSATQIYKLATDPKTGGGGMTSILTNNPAPEERTLDYLGVDNPYFCAVLMGGTSRQPEAWLCQQAYAMPADSVQQLDNRRIRTLNTTFRVVSPDEAIAPGQAATHDYHLYLGPKAPALLEQYGLGDVITYGWFWWVARPLSKLLHLFYAVFHNYGLAIIFLTVLVRGAMFPIGRKAALNAQKMQELAPEIKKIKEKYKNDLEKQGQAQRELWKKHNFNPLGSCWLMFLQFPIFIGLYRCLSVDIELRQAPLIPGISWCSNLAGPDMAWRWQGVLPDFLTSETGWLGPYLNVLPIITIALFIWQQKMFTPPATDEQTRMQQKMMQWMMVFMGIMFFKVPAGLCIYFIASSLWGIGERKLLPPPGSRGASPDSSAPGRPSAAPVPNERQQPKQSLLDRLMQKAPPESVDDIRARRKSRR